MSATTKPRTFVYIDGFNLYYGALKKGVSGHKWLDVCALMDKLLPEHDIVRVKYFTARVTGIYDPDSTKRQALYLRALQTLNRLELIQGSFAIHKKRVRINQHVDMVVVTPEEKCTDVNLAVHLINDIRKDVPDIVVIVSNDSDLSEAVRIAVEDMHIRVGILNPYDNFNKQLSRYATFKKSIREDAIRASQFPSEMSDSKGSFTKPSAW